MSQGCCFCQEYLRLSGSQYYMELGRKIGVDSRILLETEHWYAVPTLGCLTAGYVLLVCKRHFRSAANLSVELFQEMLELKAAVEARLYEKLGLPCLAFEHGSTSELESGANSVDHVHLHMLPFPRELWPDLSREHDLKGFRAVAGYGELISLWASGLPETYLLFQDVNGRIYYRPDARGVPSQFFRKCLASCFGTEEWDWRRAVHSENFLKTMELFRQRP